MASQSAVFAKTPVAFAIAMAVAGTINMAQASDAYELGEVVVTAARTAQTVDETLAPVTVITRKDIERSQATSVSEILSKTPGFQAPLSGGRGSKSSLYLRGTKTAQTLVLLDGHRLNSANGNEAPLQYLNLDQIERIEIVRGPRSSLYGADAVGGVVQIFTRKGNSTPSLTLKAGIGSDNSNELGVNYNGQVDSLRFNVGASLEETKGYDHTLTKVGRDGDDDMYRNKSLITNISNDFSENITAGVRFTYSEGKAAYDNNSTFGDSIAQPFNDFKLTNISTFIENSINEVWDTSIDLSFSQEKIQRYSEDDKGTVLSSYSESENWSTAWLNDIAWSENQLLTTGVDYNREKIATETKYKENSRYNGGVFAQNLTFFSRSDLQLGARYDKNEAYGENTTGNIAYGYQLTSDIRVIGSYATAFRAPTFFDLYYPGYSNPDLKPESAKNAELEFKGSHSFASWSVSFYQNDIDDMIILDSTYKPQNTDKARIQGVELSVSTHLAGWDINTNLSFLNPENRTTGKQLERRSKRLFNLDLDHNFGRFSAGGTIRAQGESYDDAANNESVAGFVTADLRLAMQVVPQLKAEVKVINLMDKEYQTSKGYRGESRGGFLTLTWTPKL